MAEGLKKVLKKAEIPQREGVVTENHESGRCTVGDNIKMLHGREGAGGRSRWQERVLVTSFGK